MICAEIKLGFTDGVQGQVEASIKSSTFDDSLFECDGDLFFLFFFFANTKVYPWEVRKKSAYRAYESYEKICLYEVT